MKEVKDNKYRVMMNLYYQMDNDAMVIGEAELNLNKIDGVEDIYIDIVEKQPSLDPDYPADIDYMLIAIIDVKGTKEKIIENIKDTMKCMSVDDIEFC